ncbi:MAG: sulfite exporter TauE/SafE family protein [Bacteroidetes bacterium]|nr:sulfite exporter TauE/SafE family protein [Bacteroidota bacterium]MBS1539964.1 sulfite exporter TauE/SafE family protein [Bacteroidota bacterium]
MLSVFSTLTSEGWILVLSVALLLGMAKTGVHGAGMLSVPLLAIAFGGKISSGLMLPMLLVADVFGVFYYHRHASFQQLKTLFPWAALGVIVGSIAGNYIDDGAFRVIMAATIFISLTIMIWMELGGREKIPDSIYLGMLAGFLGGFTSMIGNLAGTVMAVYFLSMRLSKNNFIGTTAWFFMVMNWFKVPFHAWLWHTITKDSWLFALMLTPVILLGAFAGIGLVKKMSDKTYRWFIVAMTLVAAIVMVLK